MVTVITRNRVREPETYLKLALAFAADIRKEPGCLRMEVAVPVESGDEVLYISDWESREAWQGHVGGAAFNKHIPGMGPYYISGTDEFFEARSILE